MKESLYKLGISALFTTLAACSVAPYQPPAPVRDRTPPPQSTSQPPTYDSYPASPAPATAPSTTAKPVQPSPQPTYAPNPAVIALLDDASRAQRQGDYQAAQGSLQRAQRIAPRDPEIYYRLAQTHLELNNYALAEQVALKGISLAGNNPTQLRHFWHLVASIRLQAGNAKGAQQAEQKARQY